MLLTDGGGIDHVSRGAPEGPTVVLTGMLMACAESCSFLTRRPKYSSLQQHKTGCCHVLQHTHKYPPCITDQCTPADKRLLPAAESNKDCMGCQHAAQACC